MNTTIDTSTLSPAPTEALVRRKSSKKNSLLPTPKKPNLEKPGLGSAISDRTRIIVAKVNVGWGNSVYIRGEGGCLNWDLGMPMMCSGNDRWVWCCHAEEVPRQFKFLRNDQDWALGDNQIMSGADITICDTTFPG